MNIVLYVQHLLGTGHLVRTRLLGAALHKAGHQVTLVSGGPVEGPSPFHIIQLPIVKTQAGDFTTLLDAQGNRVTDPWKRVRCGKLLEVIDQIQPDLVILETWPFGRRQMEFEIMPLVERLASRQRPPMLVASIRDVLQQRKDKRRRQTLEHLAKYFSLVLVHGDPRLVSLAESFPEEAEIDCTVAYTGYIASDRDPHSESGMEHGDGSQEVIVSAGGGAAGIKLLSTAALASTGDHRTWRVLAGPNLTQDQFNELSNRQRQSLIVQRNRPDFANLLKRCAVSVSQFGYNTALDLINARCRAVMVPYSADGETEQSMRALKFEKSGYGIVVNESELNEALLLNAVQRASNLDVSQVLSIKSDGAVASVKILEQQFAIFNQ